MAGLNLRTPEGTRRLGSSEEPDTWHVQINSLQTRRTSRCTGRVRAETSTSEMWASPAARPQTRRCCRRTRLRSQTLRSRPLTVGCSFRRATTSSSRSGGAPLPHLHRDCAHPRHICTGTGLTLPTSAPGLRAPSPNPRTCPSLTASCHVAAVLQVGRGGRNQEYERVRGGNSSAALTRQLALVPPDCRLALRCDVP